MSDIITICVPLQILQNAAALITKCCTLFYTMRTLLQNAAIVIFKMRNLLQLRRYYKMPQNMGLKDK